MADAERLVGTAILCTESPLLWAFARAWLAPHVDVAEKLVHSPQQVVPVARDPEGMLRRVLVLLDPRGDEWPKRVGEARGIDRHLGVIVLTARSAYWRQRQWRQRPPGTEDRYLADGLLSLEDGPKQLLRALRESLEEPGTETRVWLAEPKHPAAHARSDEGAALEAVPHASAALTALGYEITGLDRRAAAAEAHVTYDAVQKALRRLKDDLGIESEAALGYCLTRLGIFDDLPRR